MEAKQVWLVITNTDLTEGRGKEVRLAFCEEYATARRLGKGKYVQGGDCPITKCELFKPEGKSAWFGPVTVEKPSAQDSADQSIIDAREAALVKARDAGLSDAEIKMIQKAI